MSARTAIAVLALVAAACGADPASPPATPTPPAPPAPPIPIPTDRLLTDAELVTSLDSLAPTQPEARVTWAKGAAHPIRSLTYDGDFSDLRFLETALQGRRLVQLGESGHGVSEFSLAKVRLIKYLHEELGYDVIAFESSLFACWDADARAESLGGAGLMVSCPFAVWNVAEVLPLLEYVASTKKTARPLTLAGFDVQFSTLADARRPALVRRLFVAVGDTDTADRWAVFDSTFWGAWPAKSRNDMGQYVKTNYDSLADGYDSLAAAIVARRPALEAASGRAAVAVALQSARGMRAFLDQLRAYLSPGLSTEYRDRGMANNVEFLLDSLYPGKKVITWAHNFHIRNDGHAVPQPEPLRNMGSWIAARRRAETYTVGFYMYRGTAATNSRVVYNVQTPRDANTLETILYRARLRYAFYDVAHEPLTAGSRWLWDPTPALEWGLYPYTMVVRDQYDGIVFIHTTSHPKYL